MKNIKKFLSSIISDEDINNFEVELNWYAIIDPSMDLATNQLCTQDRKFSTLIDNVSGKEMEFCPKVILLNKNYIGWDWEFINNNLLGSSSLNLVLSYLDFENILIHFKKMMNPRFESKIELYLAFWDPIVLSALIGNRDDKSNFFKGRILNEEQIDGVMNPILNWVYWDRYTNIHCILRNSNENVFFRGALNLSIKQEEQLVRATQPDTILYYLKLNNKIILDVFDCDDDIYNFVCECLNVFYEINMDVDNLRDIIDLICILIIFKFHENNDEKIKIIFELLRKNQNNWKFIIENVV